MKIFFINVYFQKKKKKKFPKKFCKPVFGRMTIFSGTSGVKNEYNFFMGNKVLNIFLLGNLKKNYIEAEKIRFLRA